MSPNPTAPRAYYAEAIDRRQSGPRSLGYQVTGALADRGVTVYRPATTWRAGHLNPDYVERINRAAMLDCNVIVADLSDDSYTLGVPMEIEACTARGIPAVVLWDGRRPRSVSLQANPLVHFVDLNDHTEWVVAVALADKHARHHWALTGRGVEPGVLKFTMAAGAEPPRMAFDDDAGFDLVTAVDTEIPGHSFVDVPTTITGVQCPPGTWLLITGRSSTVRKRGLLVPNGVIDTGWRGPLFAGVYNLSPSPVIVRAGERVAQAILQNGVTEHHPIRVVDALDPHPRGLNGFGSTGGTGQAAPEASDQDRQALAQKVGGWINPRYDEVFPVNTEQVQVYAPEHDQKPEPGWASEGERLQALG